MRQTSVSQSPDESAARKSPSVFRCRANSGELTAREGGSPVTTVVVPATSVLASPGKIPPRCVWSVVAQRATVARFERVPGRPIPTAGRPGQRVVLSSEVGPGSGGGGRPGDGRTPRGNQNM